MPKFCPNCGEDINEKVKFCPLCGVDIITFMKKSDNANNIEGKKFELKSENIKIEETKIEDKKIDKKYSLSDIVVKGGIVVVIFIVLLAAVSHLSTSSNNAVSAIVSGANQGNFIPIHTESQTERNIRIANEIVATYHSTHTYSLNDFYVCGDMASDVWDMLKAQGINAKINVGSVDKDVTKIGDANHAWVLAEVVPNQYLALEVTGGYSVQKIDNPRYYNGWSFYNPKQFKNYLQLSKQYNDAVSKHNSASNDFNAILNQYYNAGLLTRIRLKSEVDDKALILQQRTQDLNQISQQISALLSSL